MPDWFVSAFDVPRRSGYLQVEGAKLHYLQWGDTSAPSVVMLHGMMAHARCWAFIAPFLADNYCVTALDLSGMGDSEAHPEYTMKMRGKEIVAAAAQLGGGEPVALICHSFGASVGLTAAERSPRTFSKLIICDMAMMLAGEETAFADRRRRRAAIKSRPHRVMADLTAVRERFRLAPPQPCENQFLLDYMAIHSVRQVEDGYVWKFDPGILGGAPDLGEDWWPSIAPRFARLPLQRAVVYGEHSPMMTGGARRFVTEATAGTVPMVQVDDAYHHIMLDQPQAFIEILRSLLQ